MQAATIVIAFAALNPAAFFQLVGNARGVGARRAQRAAQLGRLNAVVFLRLKRDQRHKQCLVNPLRFQHLVTVFQQLSLHMHAKAGEQNFLKRKVFVTAGAELEHLLNGSKRTIHFGYDLINYSRYNNYCDK
ncbi:Uncharacterised protein [Klebsiella pneumoniae]|nr:Uncharacterised protein [Klebsiella pneumoniae]